MEVIDNFAPGCKIKPQSSNKIWKFKMLRFIDNKRHYVSFILQQIKQSLEKGMFKSVNIWEVISSFVGDKCPNMDCTYYNGSSIQRKTPI